jgi:hypothetical protein
VGGVAAFSIAREMLLLLSEFKAVLHQAFVPLLLMLMGFLLDRLR